MKRFIALAVVAPLVMGGVAFGARVERDNICHATGSQSHPWEAISISDNNHNHDGHAEDFEYLGPLKNGKPTKDGNQWCADTQTPEEEPTPPVVVTPTPPTPPAPAIPVEDTNPIPTTGK